MGGAGGGELRMEGGEAGVWSLPVSLLLGAILATATVAIGTASLARVERLERARQAVEDFNNFVEAVRLLSFGGEGSVRRVAVRGEAEIDVWGTFAQLKLSGDVLRAEPLPIPISAPATLHQGIHEMRLWRGPDGRLRVTVLEAQK
ncbi:MAG: hypothetical protein ACK4GQ_00095 [Candidatus Hadarchaeales archaeon]